MIVFQWDNHLYIDVGIIGISSCFNTLRVWLEIWDALVPQFMLGTCPAELDSEGGKCQTWGFPQSWVGTPLSLDGDCDGTSESKMDDDLGKPPCLVISQFEMLFEAIMTHHFESDVTVCVMPTPHENFEFWLVDHWGVII